MLVDGEAVGTIGAGLCVLLGIERSDAAAQADTIATKLGKLRIFADDEGKMNRSVVDIAGGILLISQFTLAGDTSGGNRPSFTNAAPPEDAEPLYERVAARLRQDLERHGVHIATGRFRTHMRVEIVNDGPVTILVRT